MVFDLSELILGWFRGSNGEVPVDLTRIRRDDFAVEQLGEFERDGRLTGSSWSDEDYYLARRNAQLIADFGRRLDSSRFSIAD